MKVWGETQFKPFIKPSQGMFIQTSVRKLIDNRFSTMGYWHILGGCVLKRDDEYFLCALDEGRNVYSVPGKANSIRSQGTNNLIKQGAKLITSAEEILEDIAFEYNDLSIGAHSQENITSEQFAPQEKDILSILSSQPYYIEQVTKKCALSQAEAISMLTRLEMSHKVQRTFGGGYIKK